MNPRAFLNENPVLSAVILLIVLAGCVSFLTWWMMPRPTPEPETMAYFYDLNTKELFVAPATSVGPLETESGPYRGMPAGVRANVYSCGPMVKDAVTFIGFLEVPTEAVPEDQRPPSVELSEDNEENEVLIRRPDGDQWYVIGSPEAQAIMAEVRTRCSEGEQITFVLPPPG